MGNSDSGSGIEVLVLKNGRWMVESTYPPTGRDAALAEAKVLAQREIHDAIKVVRSVFRAEDNTFNEFTLFQHVKGKGEVGAAPAPAPKENKPAKPKTPPKDVKFKKPATRPKPKRDSGLIRLFTKVVMIVMSAAVLATVTTAIYARLMHG